MSHYLATNSGCRVDFEAPHPDQIRAEDIALALSREHRFANQTDMPSTVLQHTMFCYALAKRWGWRKDLLLVVLLHDASEAYMRDIPTRLKALLGDFQRAERALQWAICNRFGANPILLDNQKLKELDALSGKLEAHHFFDRRPDWAATICEVEADLFASCWPDLSPVDLRRDWLEAIEENSANRALRSGNPASA